MNSVYQPDTVMPGILLPIRDQLFRMLWAGKKELKRLAYTLADIFTSEFIRESDYQLARTGDPEFAALIWLWPYCVAGGASKNADPRLDSVLQ